MRLTMLRLIHPWAVSARLAFVPALIGAVWLSPSPALAQSAADIATARELATEGIKLFRQEKFAEALERLQRAQQLYDAPVHLLYIARAQAKVGQVVESAETYRRLMRTQLPANASRASRNAVEVAPKELAEVEPKVAAIEIELSPASVDGLELTIDGKPVPSAAIGIKRAANPGEHTIEANAPGYAPSSERVTLEEGETKTVSLTLTALPPTSEEAAAGEKPGATEAPPPAQSEEKSGQIGFIGGIRLGLAIPTGSLFAADTGSDEVVPGVSSLFKAGFGYEFRAGAYFLNHFTASLFADGQVFAPGSRIDESVGQDVAEAGNVISSSSSGMSYGLVLTGGSALREKFGLFGELGFLVQRYTVDWDIDRRADGTSCSRSSTLSGPALRIGGGVTFGFNDWLRLAPVAHITVGQFEKEKRTGDCGEPEDNIERDLSAGAFDQKTHTQLFIGVGGDVMFGR